MATTLMAPSRVSPSSATATVLAAPSSATRKHDGDWCDGSSSSFPSSATAKSEATPAAATRLVMVPPLSSLHTLSLRFDSTAAAGWSSTELAARRRLLRRALLFGVGEVVRVCIVLCALEMGKGGVGLRRYYKGKGGECGGC
ncbi:hypothetical protein AAHE18_06G132300 [Arachis hypogaea]